MIKRFSIGALVAVLIALASASAAPRPRDHEPAGPRRGDTTHNPRCRCTICFCGVCLCK